MDLGCLVVGQFAQDWGETPAAIRALGSEEIRDEHDGD